MKDTTITEKINAVDIAMIEAMAAFLNLKNTTTPFSDAWKDIAVKGYKDLQQAQRTLQVLRSLQAQNQVLRQIVEDLADIAEPCPLRDAPWARYQGLIKEEAGNQ